LNFHHDPLAAAVAAGWEGATIEARRLRPADEAGALRFVDAVGDEAAAARSVGVLGPFDPEAFRAVWAEAVERAQGAPGPAGLARPDQ
jgi:hypothetical protein